MKKLQLALIAAALAGISQASAALYEVTFTGADIWNMSPDAAALAANQQSAPRRYSTFNNATTGAPDGTGPRVVQATTYGVNGPTPSTVANLGFNTWAASPAGQSFAFQSINLWGAGGAAAAYFGETYQSIGTPAPDYGVSSWTLVSAPAGWTGGIVEGGQSYSASATQAFPVWRFGTGAALSQANAATIGSWTYIVDIANPATAFLPNGELAVFFGGYSDDNNGAGAGNYEISGVMDLTATPVPEPTTMIAGALLLLPFGASTLRRMRKTRTA